MERCWKSELSSPVTKSFIFKLYTSFRVTLALILLSNHWLLKQRTRLISLEIYYAIRRPLCWLSDSDCDRTLSSGTKSDTSRSFSSFLFKVRFMLPAFNSGIDSVCFLEMMQEIDRTPIIGILKRFLVSYLYQRFLKIAKGNIDK